MKRYIRCAESNRFTEQEVISMLRSAGGDNKITVSKGVAQYWSYERDFFAIAYIKDIVKWANQEPEWFADDPGSSISGAGESVGARTAKSAEYMYEKVRELKEKYGIAVKPKRTYPKVAETAVRVYSKVIDLGNENNIQFKENVDRLLDVDYVNTLVSAGKVIVIYPKLGTVLMKGRWAGLAAYLCPDESWASDDSRKLSKIIRNNVDQLRNDLGIPSLESVGAQGNLQFSLNDL